MIVDLALSLRTHFGFDSFRAGQEEAIRSLLDHNHTLAIMPTGTGKSLIYQLAALQFDGLTLVISPLIALMKDQTDALNRRGIPATFINSAIPLPEQNQRLTLLAQGKYRLVYVAPERLRNVTFLRALQSQTLSLLAVDEAHCISEWGHDFRPDYLHIAEARRKLGNPLTVALTATATPKVQDEIVRLLGLPESTRRIVTGFNRPNLSLEVRYTDGLEAKLRALSELLRKPEFNSGLQGATLIYTGTRRDAEEVAEFVRVVCKTQAEHYHAGLLPEDRARIQERFINGSTPVIVATNAFGMGIDRPDVRQVIHYAVPGSLEAYYQEAGRAGRDGLPARAILLYDPRDRALQEFFIQNSIVSPNELHMLYRALGNGNDEIWLTLEDFQRRTGLPQVKVKVGLAELERIGALEHLGDDNVRMLLKRGAWNPAAVQQAAARSKEHVRHRSEQLDHMIAYAESNACRRRIILQHFGDRGSADAPVCCDNCETNKAASTNAAAGDVSQMSHAERAALVILDCIRRAKTRVGKTKLAQILHGSKAQDILAFHHDKNIYYGRLASLRQSDIERLIAQLIEMNYIKVIGGEYPILVLTPRGENALQQKERIALTVPKSFQPSEIKRAKAKLEAGGTVEYTAKLFAEGMTPEQIARERGLAVTTIYGHLAQWIAAGKLNVAQVIPDDVRLQIEQAIQQVGSTQYLSPIKALLPESIDFNMIRCVVAAQGSAAKYTSHHSDMNVSATGKDSLIQSIVDSGERKDPESIPTLIAALKHSDGNVRRLAASALGKIGDVQAIQPLMDLLATETKPQVRQYAVKALGRIGDSRPIALLQQIADDESEMHYTREAARHAIANIHRKTSHTTSSDTEHSPPSRPDPITTFLASSHPRPLKGNWQAGFALDFHSSFTGADWNRSGIGDLVYRLKYESDASVLPKLIEQTRALFAAHPEMNEFDLIVPVPSSTPRAFSPVHEFCKALASALNKPMQMFVVKTRQTKPQKEMHTLPQKRDNVAGAFAVNHDITGKRILLVDDLFDSGATLEEITRLLLAHHAARVNVLTFTKTIHADS